MNKLGHVLVGGGTGFIGSYFTNLLSTKGYGVTIVSRMPGPQRISWNELVKYGLPSDVTAVVNLAGQNVLDPTKRWTSGFKQNVWTSRVNTTASLAEAIKIVSQKPKVFITISGVGIYEPSNTVEYTEDSPTRCFDFLSKLCQEWEFAAKLPTDLGVRQVSIRSGVVLGRNGGMIKQLYFPFFCGLGGPIGNGCQYMPWVHIHDLTKLFLFAIENEDVEGIVNGVAPQVVTNKEFATAFGRAMWRPAFIPVPEFLINLAFGEERAQIMTRGQKVIAARALHYAFPYKYPNIDHALQDICKRIRNP